MIKREAEATPAARRAVSSPSRRRIFKILNHGYTAGAAADTVVLPHVIARIWTWLARKPEEHWGPADPPIFYDRDLCREDIPNVDSPDALWRFARSCEERDDTSSLPGRLAAWTASNYCDTGSLPSDLSTLRISLMHACSGPLHARRLLFHPHFDRTYVEVLLEHIKLAVRKRDQGDAAWLTTDDVCTRVLNAAEAYFRRRGTTYEDAVAKSFAEFAERGIMIPDAYLPSRACQAYRRRAGQLFLSDLEKLKLDRAAASAGDRLNR